MADKALSPLRRKDIETGRKLEREAIVAYIRREQLDEYNERTAKETEAWWYSNAIEAGEHLK